MANYTNEKAVLWLIAALKAYGIKKIIVSPGSSHFTLVASLQRDEYFELYSCVDERSAAYMACGMATETGSPICIACTGATAPRNYLPALTEAYYRKLPILAICGHRGVEHIGHLKDQQLDRRNEPVDVAQYQAWLPYVKDKADELYCKNELNKSMLALKRNGGGPVIINLCTHYNTDMMVNELPEMRPIGYHMLNNAFPTLPSGRIAITLGSHVKFSNEETELIDKFCGTHDAVVFCDHTSGYYGKYAVHPSLIFGQPVISDLAIPDLIICAGEISGDGLGVLRVWSSRVWRVNEDGEFRNRTGNVTDVYAMSLPEFCKHYICDDGNNKLSYLEKCKQTYMDIYSNIPQLPFSNVWVAQQLSGKMPQNSSIYFAINNSLRSWNFFELPDSVECESNVGGYGIDGSLSTVVGRAIANPQKIAYCVLGDLAFYYDMNALGNRDIKNNIRIILINNGVGEEFCLKLSPAYELGEEVKPYIAAAGHYCASSGNTIKNYVESLGFKYFRASSQDEFLKIMPDIVNEQISQSSVFEIIVDSENEKKALDDITTILSGPKKLIPLKKIKKGIKSIVGDDKIQALKTLLK